MDIGEVHFDAVFCFVYGLGYYVELSGFVESGDCGEV